MGAAASLELTPETKDILSAESGKDLNAADVDTPRGESAKAEVVRLRGILKARYDAEQAAAAAAAEAAPAEALQRQMPRRLRPRPRPPRPRPPAEAEAAPAEAEAAPPRPRPRPLRPRPRPLRPKRPPKCCYLRRKELYPVRHLRRLSPLIHVTVLM